ncbi:MAG: DUF3817 domain-containing protein [Bacteroidetes bacterium]|nr:DUF3817 domain-containing protein [Bacteroidota bacterium]MBK8145505.1 DUF3817 domain-containing protein [Bacteroidota bacterium]MBP6315560.1 DUF3817 domain-containing protein [Chitinophagaceae bacterium]
MNNKTKVIHQLRIIGLLEGISYLILLCISMPLKYLFQLPQAVVWNGWVHGALFVLFALAVLQAWIVCRWPFKRAFTAGLLSLLPIGTFLFDKSLKAEQATYQ